MTAYSLIIGTRHKTPEVRISSNGNPYCMATVRFQQKNRAGESETLFASVTAFREDARAALEYLRAGDAVSAGGVLTLGVWERAGVAHPSINLVAYTISTARPKPKPRSTRPSPGPHDDHALNDDIDF